MDIFKDKHRYCETKTDRDLNAAERIRGTSISRPTLDIEAQTNSILIKYGAPYRIENGVVVTVTNEIMYDNVISEAFNLLDGLDWKAANQHFQEIYEEFSKNNFEQVVFLCGKCLEDVMKTCCRKVGINVAETLTCCVV